MSTPPRNLPAVASQQAARTNNQSASGNVDSNWWSAAQMNLFSKWASSFTQISESFSNPYFDYFYTGQDIQVTIDGLQDPADILPIYSCGYNITQQKQPLYGWWSYTYDAMLRGTRIVSGAFSLVATEPYLLTSKIAKAAYVRSTTTDAQNARYPIPGLDEDEQNIANYWRKNLDTSLDMDQQHLFSVHPPFNLIIKYGLQETSIVDTSPSKLAQSAKSKYGNSSPMMTDFNERLVQNPTVGDEMKIIIENVEIVSKSIEYNSEGDPVIENYTFMARDERMLNSAEFLIANTGNTGTVPSESRDIGISLPPEGIFVNPVKPLKIRAF